MNLLNKTGLFGMAGSLLGEKVTPPGTHELASKIEKEFDIDNPQNSLERILKESGQWGGQEGVLGTALGGPAGGGLGLAHGSASGAFYGGLKELGLDDKWALPLTMIATLSPIAAKKIIPKIEEKLFKNSSKKNIASNRNPPDEPPPGGGGGSPPGDLGGGAGPSPGGRPPEPPGGSGGGHPPSTSNRNLPDEPPPGGGPGDLSTSIFSKQPIKRMESGLTEPRALEAPHIRFATINPERQKHAIDKLNQEASQLTEKAVSEHLPLSKQIEEGFDFHGQFEKDFGNVQKLAFKANPDIDISPLSDFLRKTAKEYREIPTLHPETKKIVTEINFRNKGIPTLRPLLKIYRSNNRKIRGIYETAALSGKQKEYVDFLLDMNKKISESFVKTLPADSPWLKKFLDTNKTYKNYLDANKAMSMLKPLLTGEITPAKLKQFGSDERFYKKLKLSMGEKGATEIKQIANDLYKASQSIKNIPTRELKMWESIFPFGLLIPFVKIPAAIGVVVKSAKLARNIYGYWLSTLATQIF